MLNGHEHSYERFSAQRDPAQREPGPNSAVRWNDSFGVLALTLRADGHDWRSHGTPGSPDVDAGTASCR